MSNPSVITLRVSSDLKDRLSLLARQQGVSMNQLVTYFLTETVTAMEMNESVKKRLERIESKSKDELVFEAKAAFARLKARQASRKEPIEIPDWDRWPEDDEELPPELLNEKVAAKFVKAGKSQSQFYQPPSRPSRAVHEPNAEYNPESDI